MQELVGKQTSEWELDYPKANGILDDIGFMTEEGQDLLKGCVSEDKALDYTNLLYAPKGGDSHSFTYI